MSVARRRVVVLEMNVVVDMFPLVCGYLEAYAYKDPALVEAYEFVSVTSTPQDPIEEVIERLIAEPADFYALSCYVWNMGWMKEIGKALRERMPDATVVLGGPQVMHYAHRYIPIFGPNTIVCDGEGEVTFSNLLRALLDPEPDLSQVNGVSFQRDGVLVTCDPEPRIADLDSIPSPFLDRLLQNNYRMVVFETNRGCPYSCGFCYWGAATASKIHRFSEERVRAELATLAEHRIPALFIADANWGILKRDVEFSREIVEVNRRTRYPLVVTFQSAKNKPERVAEISKMFADANMMSTHPISMQSLDPKTLELVNRSNIKLENFEAVQDSLNAEGIGSLIELIWPLPGETLESFRQGIGTLCGRGGRNLVVYSHMLLHNTPMYEQRDELGFTVEQSEIDSEDVEVVVGTADVTAQDYNAGLWFIAAVTAFHNSCAMFTLEQYLDDSGAMTYADLLTMLGEWLATSDRLAMSANTRTTIEEGRFHDSPTPSHLYHGVLHDERNTVTEELRRVFSAQPWWRDSNAQVLFELDALLSPVLYRDTDLSQIGADFRHLKVRTTEDAHVIEALVPGEYAELIREYLPAGVEVPDVRGDLVLQFDHRQGQLRLPKNSDDVWEYRMTQISRVVRILPTVTGREEALRPVVFRTAKKLLNRSKESAKARMR